MTSRALMHSQNGDSLEIPNGGSRSPTIVQAFTWKTYNWGWQIALVISISSAIASQTFFRFMGSYTGKRYYPMGKRMIS